MEFHLVRAMLLGSLEAIDGRVSAYVLDTNLAGQLFLQRMGFRCIEHFTPAEFDQEVYHFEYRLPCTATQRTEASA